MALALDGMNKTLQLIERRGLPSREPVVEAERDPTILRKLFDKAWPN